MESLDSLLVIESFIADFFSKSFSFRDLAWLNLVFYSLFLSIVS